MQTLSWKLPQPLSELQPFLPYRAASPHPTPAILYPCGVAIKCAQATGREVKQEGLSWDEGYEFKGSSCLFLSGEQETIEVTTFSTTLRDRALFKTRLQHFHLHIVLNLVCACAFVHLHMHGSYYEVSEVRHQAHSSWWPYLLTHYAKDTKISNWDKTQGSFLTDSGIYDKASPLHLNFLWQPIHLWSINLSTFYSLLPFQPVSFLG